jgi:hypothetical protein
MNASAKRSTAYLALAVIVGCAFLVLTGVAYVSFAHDDLRRALLAECFKTSLTFTFIAIGSAIVKSVLDAEVGSRTALKAEVDSLGRATADIDPRADGCVFWLLCNS